MRPDEKYAKLLALSVIYEKQENQRKTFIDRMSLTPGDVNELISNIHDVDFKKWVLSITS